MAWFFSRFSAAFFSLFFFGALRSILGALPDLVILLLSGLFWAEEALDYFDELFFWGLVEDME